MRRLSSLLLAASACTWISDDKYIAELQNVDDDGDGVLFSEGDCNDNNASISPLVEEIWYDGIDSDCKGDNDFDADNDGYVPIEHTGKMTTSYNGDVLPLPGGDCNDEDPDSYPSALDSPYDGVDSDCDGEDDYDQDDDGYVPSIYEGMSTQNLEDQELREGGDCNDADANVNPGEIDNWYDGIDSDCGGENDYDQDDDGFAYDLLDSSIDIGDLQPGDCDDQNPSIKPDQSETWYDGIDSDCARDDDYDQDGDGYVPSEYEGLETEQVNGSGNLEPGDCDDQDPERYEGALEQLSDPTKDFDCDLCIDSNCDDPSEDGLGGDSFLIESSEWYSFSNDSNPQNIRYAVNDDTLFVSSRADVVITIHPTNNSAITYHSASYVATFDLANLTIEPSDFFRWRGRTDNADPNPYSDRQSVVATNDYFIGAIGQFIGTPSNFNGYRRLRLSAKALAQTYYFHLSSRTDSYFPPIEDVSVMVDSNDVIHAVGCEATSGLLQYVRMPVSGLIQNTSINLEVELEVENMQLERCEIQEVNGVGVLKGLYNNDLYTYSFPLTACSDPQYLDEISCDAASETWDADNINFTLVSTDSTYDSPVDYMISDTTDDGIEIIGDTAGIYIIYNSDQYQVSTDSNPRSVYGYRATNGDLIIGYASSDGIGKLLIGDPDTFITPGTVQSMEEHTITTSFDVNEVAPFPFEDADGDKLFVSLLGDLQIGFGIVLR
jgi:hypothetical protein